MYNQEPTRCRKCGEKDQTGMAIGTILPLNHISVDPGNGKPWIPVAEVSKCCLCGWLSYLTLLPGKKEELGYGKYKVLPSEAEKMGITLHMVSVCFNQLALSAYTLKELKAGKVKAARNVEPSFMTPAPSLATGKPIDYNPNAFIEAREADDRF
jgi:hypothetical protein